MKFIMPVSDEKEQKMGRGDKMSVEGGCNKTLHSSLMFGTTGRTLNVLLFFGVPVLGQKCSSIQGMSSPLGSPSFHQDRIFSDHSA